jgi:hypothetical protein
LFVNHRLFGLDALEDVLERPLHDASILIFFKISVGILQDRLWVCLLVQHRSLRALDGIRFTSTSLAIGKDRAIVALQAAIRNWFGNVIKYRELINLRMTNEVKTELLDIAISTIKLQKGTIFDCNTILLIDIVVFSFIERANSYDDLYFVVVLSRVIRFIENVLVACNISIDNCIDIT